MSHVSLYISTALVTQYTQNIAHVALFLMMESNGLAYNFFNIKAVWWVLTKRIKNREMSNHNYSLSLSRIHKFEPHANNILENDKHFL